MRIRAATHTLLELTPFITTPTHLSRSRLIPHDPNPNPDPHTKPHLMAPLEEAHMCIHAAAHGLQEVILLSALHLSHLAGAIKPGLLSSCLQAPPATQRSFDYTPPPPPPLHINLGQREAQVNHELPFNHA